MPDPTAPQIVTSCVYRPPDPFAPDCPALLLMRRETPIHDGETEVVGWLLIYDVLSGHLGQVGPVAEIQPASERRPGGGFFFRVPPAPRTAPVAPTVELTPEQLARMQTSLNEYVAAKVIEKLPGLKMEITAEIMAQLAHGQETRPAEEVLGELEEEEAKTKCDACGKTATTLDVEGVPLCAACTDALATEPPTAPEIAPPPPPPPESAPV